ncbi:hypothetical protein GCM10009789_48990 [Kribbella sancticallisti]|uniref:Uncharacterized protein n=1 Tax=Kribbella sancticallisti TaxID=460087 RepID=A0ABN2DZ01_9ACTN
MHGAAGAGVTRVDRLGTFRVQADGDQTVERPGLGQFAVAAEEELAVVVRVADRADEVRVEVKGRAGQKTPRMPIAAFALALSIAAWTSTSSRGVPVERTR